MANKRKDFQDSQIMDALDAENYNVSKAAGRLGVQPNTLYKWIKDSENLSNYVKLRTDADAVKARDKLNFILEHADSLDPRQMGHIISICKILIDKAESDKSDININQQTKHKIDEDLKDKIQRLLED